MSMNGGQYNPPRDKRDMIPVIRAAVERGVAYFESLSEAGLQTLRRAHAIQPVAALQNEYSLLWRGPAR